jgi:hypothetical protein
MDYQLQLMHSLSSRLELTPFLQHLLSCYVRFSPLIEFLSHSLRERVLAVVDLDGVTLETDPEKQLALSGATDTRSQYFLDSLLNATYETINQHIKTLPFGLRQLLQQLK